jgi:hypothetical protein
MKFLVSTLKGLLLCEWGKYEIVVPGRFYGLTFANDRLFAFERVEETKTTNMQVFYNDLKLVHNVPYQEISDNHQAHYNPETKEIAVANTHHNCITLINTTNYELSHINWTFMDGNVHHINSCWHNGHYWFFLEHNGKRRVPGRVVQHDGASPVAFMSVPTGGHNVYCEDGWVHVCSSEEGGLWKWHLKSGDILKKNYKCPVGNDKAIHTRGLARPASKEYYLVGGSYYGTRGYRFGKKNGVIFMVDNDFNIIDHMIIEDLSQIYEIRLLEEEDLAHNKEVFYVNA